MAPHRAGRSTGKGNQAAAEGFQIGHGNLRFGVAVGLEKGAAHQFQEIAVSGLVLDQKHQLVGR